MQPEIVPHSEQSDEEYNAEISSMLENADLSSSSCSDDFSASEQPLPSQEQPPSAPPEQQQQQQPPSASPVTASVLVLVNFVYYYVLQWSFLEKITVTRTKNANFENIGQGWLKKKHEVF